MWLLFTEPAWRDLYGGWDSETVRRSVARFRRAFAAHVDDPSWQRLVNDLSARSPEFRKHWARHEIASLTPKCKSMHHPVLGPCRFAVTSLWVGEQPGARVVVYAPHGDDGQAHIDRLAELAPWSPWTNQA
jgi:hypothetical protein